MDMLCRTVFAAAVMGVTRAQLPSKSVFATGNPHIDGSGFNVAAATALITPGNVVYTPKETQPDTLQKIVTVSFLGLPLPVYLFRQPARLNTGQLPFKLVLLRSIEGLEGAHVLDTPGEKAYDSWFPGYRWDVVVVDAAETKVKSRWSRSRKASTSVTHMGWQFSNGVDKFYALIVEYVGTESESNKVLSSLRVGITASPAILSLLALETTKGASAA
eukprot:m.431501 g.431501  ORF g.431501 m.431501 type:complete len:217 (-) comp17309_c0_seq1:1651-2301(-)